MDQTTQSVQAQYEAFPYPMMAAHELIGVNIPVSSFDFVHYYCHHKPFKERTLRVLDAGCGTGFSTLKLAQANPQAEIIAFDLSAKSLGLAKERLTLAKLDHRVKLHQNNLLEPLELTEKFDYIHCTGVLHHTSNPLKALQNLASYLKPKGLLYLMIYSGPARYQIRQIQKVLRRLWHNTNDLTEGVNLCRAFFHGLPLDHPFKQAYLAHKKTMTEQFSASFAESDHFLIDTYLQQCEQDIDLSSFFKDLSKTPLHFLRFLDESDWQAHHYLPSLPDYVQGLSKQAQYELIDQLRLEQNYAFFLSPSQIERPELIYDPPNTPSHSSVAQLELTEASGILRNQLGQEIPLNTPSLFLWRQIDGIKSWQDILTLCAQEFGFGLKDTEDGLAPLIQDLLQNYFVF